MGNATKKFIVQFAAAIIVVSYGFQFRNVSIAGFEIKLHFLGTLVHDGADAYQLFDSWAGMLDGAAYARWAQPHHQTIFATVAETPRILFVKEGPYLDLMAASGAEVSVVARGAHLEAIRISGLRLIAQGCANKVIAKKLDITEGTVKGYVSQILAKLGVEDRTQAALHALRKGLVDQ